MAETAEARPRRAPLSRAIRIAIGFVAGLLLALGTAPYNLLILALAGLVMACWLFLRTRCGRSAALAGWTVGLGYFGLSLGWIVEPFLVDAAVTGWMAPIGLLGLGGGLALFWGLAFWLAAQFGRVRAPALVVAWCAVELLRAYVFTGFPWGLLSYVWLDTPVLQWVSVIGPHGLVAATVALGMLLALAVDGLQRGADAGRTNRSVALAGLGAVFVGGLWFGGLSLLPPPDSLENRPFIRLIQPNAPQHQKWDPAHIPTFFDRQMRFTEAPSNAATPPVLIVWPETALPVLLNRADATLALIAQASGGVPVALGIQREDAGNWYNSMVVLDAQGGVAQTYDKHHLVPFGEYMPFPAFFRMFEIGGLAARANSGYAAGPGPDLLDLGPGLGRALPLICYEAVFPQDVRGTPDRPDFLLQLTNDAWFGHWSGPYQHLAQARIRAVEMGLPMVRAANTGVSAMIDRGGRVLGAIPLGQAGLLDAALPPPGPPTLYSRTGDWPVALWLCLAALALIGAVRGFPIDPAGTGA
ncbi:apolipoprotein N-acyltransferase [Cognatishimia sp. F0-27]|uniref:apolipoprotein N-acyltransferase n=1 Tax=Cognatishimia sp. F0-27 TaxID=2816855 RepID=UPI001D0CB78B|nr:apolipoprotein N-acyltransferase [Cognatishimia sp. F0-27]MCC1494360.1 apolipoprotein N-acyltransferase [Cognatishimia sp. F0-27]